VGASGARYWGNSLFEVERDHSLVYMAAQLAAAMPDFADAQCAFYGRILYFGFDR